MRVGGATPEHPARSAWVPPTSLRLLLARKVLEDFATLWRIPAVPDRLREGALREILSPVDDVTGDGAGRGERI